MNAVITSKLYMPASSAWERVKQSSTLVYVCKGVLGFQSSQHFPTDWRENQTIFTRLKLFGSIPAWHHSIYFAKLSDDEMTMRTHEQGGMIRQWQHEIRIRPLSATSCVYIDSVEINAGLLTPAVWIFANAFYRYRQRRWRHFTRKPA